MNAESRWSLIARQAQRHGWTLLGVAPVAPALRPEELRQWLADGRTGDMSYLTQDVEERLDPTKLVPGAKSILCVADRHATQWSPQVAAQTPCPPARAGSRALGPDSVAHGRIARYAWGDDYHQVIKRRLHRWADDLRQRWPEHTFRSCVDTAPVLEREHAQRAGLGWVGKHTLLLHPRLGSWFLLGEIITTLEVPPPRADDGVGLVQEPITDHCGTCTRCLDACPTQCLTPYHIDPARCLSYLTLEHRGPIAPELHPLLGDWLAGCDVCQEVCPFNAHAEGAAAATPTTASDVPGAGSPGARHEYQRPGVGPSLPLLDVLGWDEEARRAALVRSALKRVKLEQFKRNALIAAGNYLANHDDPALHQRITTLANDPTEPELVRLTAQQVCRRLRT